MTVESLQGQPSYAGIANEASLGGRGRQMLGWLVDAGVLLLLVLAFPLVILVVGTPVALVVRLLIEISRRWW
jgi:hypothetical protein